MCRKFSKIFQNHKAFKMKDGMALFCVREFDLSRPEKLEMEFKNFNHRQKSTGN